MEGWRTIVVDGRAWSYQIGRGSIVARSGDSTRNATFSDITGIPQDVIYRAMHRNRFYLKPADIAMWLAD